MTWKVCFQVTVYLKILNQTWMIRNFQLIYHKKNQDRAGEEYYASMAKHSQGMFSSQSMSGSSKTNLKVQELPDVPSTKEKYRKMGEKNTAKVELNEIVQENTRNIMKIISNPSYSAESIYEESQLSPTNLSYAESQLSPTSLSYEEPQLSPTSLSYEESQLSSTNLSYAESQLSPTNSSSTGRSQMYTINLSEGDIEFSFSPSTYSTSTTDDQSTFF